MRVVRCESAKALSNAPVSRVCFSCSELSSSCKCRWTDDDEIDVGAVDAPENVVRGVDTLSDNGVPSPEEMASELVTVREMLPLRRPRVDDEPMSEKPARDGA